MISKSLPSIVISVPAYLPVAHFHFHLHVRCSGAHCDDFTCERFFLGGVGDKKSAGCFFFCGIRFDQNPVC